MNKEEPPVPPRWKWWAATLMEGVAKLTMLVVAITPLYAAWKGQA